MRKLASVLGADADAAAVAAAGAAAAATAASGAAGSGVKVDFGLLGQVRSTSI